MIMKFYKKGFLGLRTYDMDGNRIKTKSGEQSPEDFNKDIESIRIPEGVYSATVYSCRNVTQAYLPSTLKHMIYRGFPYSFEFADGCTINYNGTVAQWQEIVDFSVEHYYCAVDTYGTNGASVVCRDGVWHQPENY